MKKKSKQNTAREYTLEIKIKYCIYLSILYMYLKNIPLKKFVLPSDKNIFCIYLTIYRNHKLKENSVESLENLQK